MKKFYVVLIGFLFSIYGRAQIISIPDAGFKSKLVNIQVPSQYGNFVKDSNGNEIVLDSNHDGEIQVSEVLPVRSLGLSMGNISSLEGIQSFTNLKYIEMFLIAGLQNLDEINTLTGLVSVDIATCADLTSLNFNPLVNLNYINISSHPNLKSLYIKNGKDETVEISYCAGLEFVCADETQIADVQAHVVPTCVVNSYCSFTPGGIFYTIQGSNTYDSNGNGCDALDSAYPNTRYNLANGSVTTSLIATGAGQYSVPVQIGTHTITPVIENPSYFNISPSSAVVTFPATPNPATRNFCISANGTHNDLEIVLIPQGQARPGFNAVYRLIYKNKGTHNQSGVLNLSFDDQIMDFVSSDIAFSTQATGLLTWNFSNLKSLESSEILITFNLNSPTENPPLDLGSVLNFDAEISGLTDETPLDNTFALHQQVVNSLDPNDKTCLEGTTIAPEMVGKYVHYLIRFENNGTANAQHVVVKDLIDTTKFDLSSLVPIKGSHPFVTRISATNKVEFLFENIELPFNDASNDGYVVFKIKTKPTLVLGNTFSNTASIYFDYNAPIATNTYVTTIAALKNQDFDFGSYFVLSPNPVTNLLTIQNTKAIDLSSINIYNAFGQLVLTKPNAAQIKSIDVTELKAGTYFLSVISNRGKSSAQFVKQ